MFVVSLIFSVTITYKCSDAISKVYSYIVNELPDFEFKDGTLHFDNYVDAYDHDYGFRLLADTTENISEEKIKEYKNKIYSGSGYGTILLNNKLIIITADTEDTTQYSEYLTSAGLDDSESVKTSFSNKQDLVNILEKVGISNILASIFIFSLIGVYIVNLLIILSDVCVVAIFGWFAARICGVNFKMNPMIAMAIYGLSLSIILDLVFDVIYIITGFSVEYFNVIYLLIAYVYIIAAIFMIKYDLIKHTEELKKIIEVQKQVEKDLAQERLEKGEEKQEEEIDKKQEEKEDMRRKRF